MNGHESYLIRIMIKVMIMVTIKINDEFRNTGVYIRRKDSLMSSIRTINTCSLFRYRLHRCWWRMLETKCVDDNSEMLVTAYAFFVTNILYLSLASGTNNQKMSIISKFYHNHPKIDTKIKSPTSTCHQHLCSSGFRQTLDHLWFLTVVEKRVILVTSLRWWLYDDDRSKMLAATSICWPIFSVTNISNLSSIHYVSNTRLQHRCYHVIVRASFLPSLFIASLVFPTFFWCWLFV